MLLLKTDIPFNRDEGNRFLPVILGLMVCLTALFLGAALTLFDVMNHNRRADIRTVQIIVPYMDKGQAQLAQEVMATLKVTKGVQSVAALSQADISRLLLPWTGEALPLAGLPLPSVVIVTVSPDAPLEAAVAMIQKKMVALNRAITVDNYQEWLDQMLHFTQSLFWLAIILAAAMLIALAVMVVMAARTSLRLNFKTVSILHNIGAQDEYIIRQFVINALWMVLRGAAFGTGIAIILLVSLSLMASQLDSPLIPEVALTPLHILMFIGLPAFALLVAYVAVRLTIQSMLEHMH